VLYCFFIIGHGRRRISHFNVTSHPTAGWILQQWREAFPYQSAPRYLIFDRDAKYGLEVPLAVRRSGTVGRKLSARSSGSHYRTR
jgi:hypothetical protein